jgi:hypothetical protein
MLKKYTDCAIYLISGISILIALISVIEVTEVFDFVERFQTLITGGLITSFFYFRDEFKKKRTHQANFEIQWYYMVCKILHLPTVKTKKAEENFKEIQKFLREFRPHVNEFINDDEIEKFEWECNRYFSAPNNENAKTAFREKCYKIGILFFDKKLKKDNNKN